MREETTAGNTQDAGRKAVAPIHGNSIDFDKPGTTKGLKSLPPYLLDLSAGEVDIPYLLYYKNIGMFPRGDIQALFGKKKSGKTTAARLFITAILKGEYKGFSTKDKKQLKVLIADTEQAPGNVKRNARRIQEAAGWNADRNNPALLVLALRPNSKKERWQIIATEVARFKPDFVFLDGIVDICEDFNDAKASGEAVLNVMKLSAENECAVLCVLHFNKGTAKDSEAARGHLGGELANKVSESYIVERENGKTKVTPQDCRNDEVPPFVFDVTTDGEREEINVSDQEANPNDYADLMRLMNEAFEEDEALSHTELKKAVQNIEECTEKTARSKIKAASTSGIISKGSGARGKYTLTAKSDFISINPQDDEDII